MSHDLIPCLYCNSDNKEDDKICTNCGMELPDKHPHSGKYRRNHFKIWFWIIVIFCAVMVVYLPR